MDEDLSNGYEAIAADFISGRSKNIGAATVRAWSANFEAGQSILDVGCGFGGPYTQDFIDRGISLYGIDASASLLEEYQRRYPAATTRLEPAELSDFFTRQFDGVLSVGFMFLLTADKQVQVLAKMANAVKADGKLLFSSPYQVCEWNDVMTGLKSVSLGRDQYRQIIESHGLIFFDEYTDEGESHYYDFRKLTSN